MNAISAPSHTSTVLEPNLLNSSINPTIHYLFRHVTPMSWKPAQNTYELTKDNLYQASEVNQARKKVNLVQQQVITAYASYGIDP